MGGFMAVPTTLWSDEELEEIEQVKKCHEFAVSFVEREHYRGIPFRHGRKNTDPTAALWLEPILMEHDRNDLHDGVNQIHEVRLYGNYITSILYLLYIYCLLYLS